MNVRFVRTADLPHAKMLRDARMTDLVKLHRGKGVNDERQLRADRVLF
ncbi:MAG: hypothetical protein H5U24_19540 [Thioclava marina]|nr:hypothetical protein [Thioclava marina]MBC7147562.1 hypothetical protein [Thioclava marina]